MDNHMTRRSALILGAGASAAAAGVAGAQPQPQPPHPPRPHVSLVTSEPYEMFADRTKPWAFSQPAQGVMRFEIRLGDQGWDGDPTGPKGRHRSEVSSLRKVPFNTPVWQAWSQMIEPGQPTAGGFIICNQWHNTDHGVGRSPCVQFAYDHESLTIATDSDDDVGANGNPTVQKQYSGPMPRRGVWHHFVANYVFGASDQGLIRVWLDGQPLLDQSGLAIGTYNDPVGPYNKFGIYCANNPANMPPSFAINFANMQISMNDLSDQIGNPMPTPQP